MYVKFFNYVPIERFFSGREGRKGGKGEGGRGKGEGERGKGEGVKGKGV